MESGHEDTHEERYSSWGYLHSSSDSPTEGLYKQNAGTVGDDSDEAFCVIATVWEGHIAMHEDR